MKQQPTALQELAWGIVVMSMLAAYLVFCLWYDSKLASTPWW